VLHRDADHLVCHEGRRYRAATYLEVLTDQHRARLRTVALSWLLALGWTVALAMACGRHRVAGLRIT
jgi:hypothetical protein